MNSLSSLLPTTASLLQRLLCLAICILSICVSAQPNQQPNKSIDIVYDLAISSDSLRIAATSGTGVEIYELETLTHTETLNPGHDHPVLCLSFDATNQYIYSGDKQGLLICSGLINVPGWHHQTEGAILCLRVSPDGKYVGYGTQGGAVGLVSAQTGEVVFWEQSHTGEVNAIAFDASGSYLFSGGEDRQFQIHKIESGEVIQQRKHKSWIRDIAGDDEKEQLIIAQDKGKIGRWNLTNSENPEWETDYPGGRSIAHE